MLVHTCATCVGTSARRGATRRVAITVAGVEHLVSRRGLSNPLCTGVARTVARVWAHPHNNNPDFDFWNAVGSFNPDEPPREGVLGGVGRGFFPLLVPPCGAIRHAPLLPPSCNRVLSSLR